jgi:hypothetical protein
MLGALSTLGILWLAFNVAVIGLATIRAVRRKKLIRERSIDRLMAAHFAGVRKADHIARRSGNARVASSFAASLRRFARD